VCVTTAVVSLCVLDSLCVCHTVCRVYGFFIFSVGPVAEKRCSVADVWCRARGLAYCWPGFVGVQLAAAVVLRDGQNRALDVAVIERRRIQSRRRKQQQQQQAAGP
jgi:hypothetical protein